MPRGLILILFTAILLISFRWGFFAHKKINQYAVFTLPSEMMVFYKFHIDYLTSEAVRADKRRYADPKEAPRHFIDLELYPDELDSIPFYYPEAIERYSEDSIASWGSLPWTLIRMKYQLTNAMSEKDEEAILRYSADLGHYIADAHVPLHTTENYNGQLTDQHGIHGFWESRLPELFFDEYDLLTGKSEYIEDTPAFFRKIIRESHQAVDSVLTFEKELTEQRPKDEKYAYEERGNRSVKVYSQKFSSKYHEMLSGMVERRLRSSIKAVGDIWYTCWIDAGQPDLVPTKKISSSLIRDSYDPPGKDEN